MHVYIYSLKILKVCNLFTPDPSHSWKVYKKGVMAFILWHQHFGMTSKVTPDSLMLAWGHFLNLSWRHIFFFQQHECFQAFNNSWSLELWQEDSLLLCYASSVNVCRGSLETLLFPLFIFFYSPFY